MIWVLVVVFLHHGVWVDRPTLYVDPGRFKSYEECAARDALLSAAYPNHWQASCIKVTPPAK